MTMINTFNAIQAFRYASIRSQLKLEMRGMKSSGGPLRPRLTTEFGLGARRPHAEWIAFFDKKICDMEASIDLDDEN